MKYNKDDQKENTMVRNVIVGGMEASKEKGKFRTKQIENIVNCYLSICLL